MRGTNKKQDKWNLSFQGGAKYKCLNELFVKKLIAQFTESNGSAPSMVVDLGCGDGSTLMKFSNLGILVIGIDFSEIALKQAKRKLASVSDRYSLLMRNLDDVRIMKTDTPSGTLWICKFVLAFLENKELFLKNIHARMKKGDRFLIVTPVTHEGINYSKEDKPGIAIDIVYIERLLTEVFGSYDVFSDEYLGERGHTVSYLTKI